jgi:thiamine kinase-like enzyme
LKKFEPIDPETIREPTSNLFKEKNEKIKNISFLGRGEASAVFKVTTDYNIYALKTALYPERTQKILNEAVIRQKFIDKGVQCVPTPRYTDQFFFKNGAVIFDFAEGVHSDYKDESTVRNIARNLADIHNVEYQLIPDGLDQMMKNLKFLKKTMNHIEIDYPHLMNPSISKAFKLAQKEYEELLDENQDLFPFGISGILHGDLGGHFITDPQGKVWLVDWENSEYGDIVEEICSFIHNSSIGEDMRKIFYMEYKTHFPIASDLDLERLGYFYSFPIPAFNVCWGLDQLNTNLIYKLEPERKLVDVNSSAENWKKYFSETTASLIKEGVNELTLKLVDKYSLCL